MNKLKIFSFLFLLSSGFALSNAQTKKMSDPIVGKWYLSGINNVDITTVKCYSDSYLDFKENELSVYISELKQDETCNVMMEGSGLWENKDGVYYVDNVAMDYKITPRGNKLIWMENPELQLIFMKREPKQEVATQK